jgi:pimeloyl-ACP methyl ester carboxylesterase
MSPTEDQAGARVRVADSWGEDNAREPAHWAPLAHLQGAKPPAPEWFDKALARAPERSRISVEGAEIEVLAWGERGAPGLVLLHGHGAHADWWTPIAPFFVDLGLRVATLSWSGMGDSGWRERYSFPLLVEEMLAACEAAGLFKAAEKPMVVAHSFGGLVAACAAASHGHRFRAMMIVDSMVVDPDEVPIRPPRRSNPNRVYPTLPEALARFRLAPPQDCDNLFYLDYIARKSIKKVDGGFSWKFDPHFYDRADLQLRPSLKDAKCPLAMLWGERSFLLRPPIVASMRAKAPPGTPFIPLPLAEHHVMLDYPLAFAATTRAMIEAWARLQ